MRRGAAPVIGTVLLVGIVGVIATFLLYGIAILLVFALLGLLLRGLMRLHGKVEVDLKSGSTPATATPLPKHEFVRSVAHPAWKVAVDKRRDQRQQLLDWFIELAQRLRQLPPNERGRIDQEFAAVEKLVFDTFGQRVSAVQPDIRERLRAEPPAREVLHLDREFALTCDCRYGHWGEHLIDEAGNGRVIRRCAFCEPNTRWTERI